MKKTLANLYLSALICLGLVTCAQRAAGQQQPAPAAATSAASTAGIPDEEIPAGEVVIDGNPVLTVYEPVGTLTPQGRADAIKSRIIALARDASIPANSIHLEVRDAWTEIVAENLVIMAVTDADARGAGEPRQQLAEAYLQKIRQTVESYRQDHSWRMILRAILKTALATVFLVIALWLVRRVRLFVRHRIEKRTEISAARQDKSAWHLWVSYVGPFLLGLGTFLRWTLILALFEIFLTVTLGFYSSTREISLTATKWVLSQLELLAKSALDYLPNLVVIGVVALVTYYLMRLIKLVFAQIRKGDLKIHGFYPDWAEPTDKLIRMMVLALALVVAFPYLPGAKTPAFQGISIFLGVLLSLGSSSAVANAIAGIILTYMRSFLLGDWVQIGETMGEVVEKNMLITRLLTPKAEIITIPNATVMSGSVKNYSTEARKAGVIFYTTVSIAYEAPWRTVHELLIGAALATPHVLHDPPPFVLQRALNDFYPVYELNAYTDHPREVLNIYSDLHRNIQDKFNEAGVEICSPHYAALRDGNATSMPRQYLGTDYKSAGFRLDLNEIGNHGATPAKEPASQAAK
ncbi:MAG: mechanosensitive ion channel family protein [Silvibacterium sp.]|nr:mechanosensitive ion channel family protein [Silvibacterium sp.]